MWGAHNNYVTRVQLSRQSFQSLNRGQTDKASLSPIDFLERVLQDEIDRREHRNLANGLDRAGFEEPQTLEHFDWNAPVTFDRDRVRDLFSLSFL